MDVSAEIGRNSASKHQIPFDCGERADWRKTGRPNLSCETKFSGANWDGEFIRSVQLTTSRFGNLTRLIRTLMTLYTYFTCTYISTYTYCMYYMYHECSSRAYTCTVCTFVS